MTAWILTRGFLRDYGRNSTNVVVLVLVPIVFVWVAADSLAEAARLMGGDGTALESASAGWAAGFLAAVAMYFQVVSARDADRRLLLCGVRPRVLVAARLITGKVLALVATCVALAVLVLRGQVDSPVRVVVGTVMFALVYLGIGAVVGSIARDPVNGTAIILFVWIVDVFFGPTLSAAESGLTRLFPTHFVSLWVTEAPSGHAWLLGDLGVGLLWVAASLVGAAMLIARSSRLDHGRTLTRASGSGVDQFLRGLALGVRDLARNPVLWALLILVPAVFIVLSDVITPHGLTLIAVGEQGRLVVRAFDPSVVHAGTMAPIAVASLAMLVGLFTVLATRAADRRLCLAGMRPTILLTVRLTTVFIATLVATAAALVVAAVVFEPGDWVTYAAGNVLAALTFALLGALVGPLFGRVSGVLLAFLVPFVDVGIAQSPMLRTQPEGWAHWLPGYGSTRIVLDGGLTTGFDEWGALVVAALWLGGLLAVTGVVLRRNMAPARASMRTTSRPRAGQPR